MSIAADVVKWFGKYLAKQRPEVVLLFCLVALNAAGLRYLPDVAARLIDRVCRSFDADQERDREFQKLLLEKVAQDRQDRDGESFVVRP